MDWSENRSTIYFYNATEVSLLETTTTRAGHNMPKWYESGKIQIPLFAIIFMLSVIGNTLVILTLVQNQRMRTITNLFLLNLAVSDLLLGVLCMPFTLIGTLLRDFLFGEVMCKLLPFLQACSVSVGVWTLVAISIERYYAICHPLRSLRWQTLNHAYKLIIGIWLGSILCMMPIALLSKLKPTKEGNHKCREDWSSRDYERAYNIFLDVILLVIPLLTLAVNYSLITRTLCRGMRTEKALRDNETTNSTLEVFISQKGSKRTRWNGANAAKPSSWRQLRHNLSEDSSSPSSSSNHFKNGGLRRTNAERSLLNKKRVIKMLFVVVLEFFICWTPLFVINTIVLFASDIIYRNLGPTGIHYFQLLAYTSSCCNPITYCFMNCGFRKSFLNLFKCFKRYRDKRDYAMGSDIHMDTRWINKFNQEHN